MTNLETPFCILTILLGFNKTFFVTRGLGKLLDNKGGPDEGGVL